MCCAVSAGRSCGTMCPSPSSRTTSASGTSAACDTWYAGGSDQAWRDQVSRWADPTLARELPSSDRTALPGSRRLTEPVMRAFQPGLVSTGVGTDAGSLALTVIYTDAGWRVATATAEPR